jgi:hypothetical protein
MLTKYFNCQGEGEGLYGAVVVANGVYLPSGWG